MTKKHFYLVTGEITFLTPEQETGQIRLNAIIEHNEPNMPVRNIGKAQQSVQLQFFKKIGNADEAAKTQVLDVVLLNVSYLGEMTPEEFHAAPDGMGLQERTKPSVN